MKILVTGGAGFIGSHLVEALVKKGHKVRCLVRKIDNVEHLKKLGVELVFGDITDKESLKNIADGIDVVYHLAGILGQWSISEQVYWEIHVKGTKNIIDACLNKNIKQFIFTSSAGVVGPLPKGLVADETFPYNPLDDYEKSKAEAEKYVLSKKEKINVIIIRPEFVYGEKDMHVLGLFKQINKGYFPLFGGGKSYLHPTYIQDVINAFLLVLNNPRCYGKIFNVSGEKTYTVKEYINVVERVIGKKCLKIYIPKFIGIGTAFIIEELSSFFKIEPLLTMSRVKFFTENKNYSSRKIQKIGLKLTLLEEGLKKTIEYYKNNNLI